MVASFVLAHHRRRTRRNLRAESTFKAPEMDTTIRARFDSQLLASVSHPVLKVTAMVDFLSEARQNGSRLRFGEDGYFANAVVAAFWNSRRTSLASLLGKLERCTIST